MLVHRFLEQRAEATPDATALVDPRRAVTYAELDAQANRFAHVLMDAHVRRGDRVVIALDSGLRQVAAYLGTMKAGAVAVPLPAGRRSDRLVRAVQDCTPAACIIDEAVASEVADDHPLADVPAVFVLTRPGTHPPAVGLPLRETLAAACETNPGVRSIDLDLAAIIYTSGSTGEPRGVMLTHRNIVANTRSIISYLRLSCRDRVMCVLPFYYVYGLSLLHTHLAVGGAVVLDHRFAFPNVVLGAMREHRVTGFAGVPSSFALLLHRSNLEEVDLPDLRYVTQAGGGMPPARIEEWLERGPKVDFYVMYGATEASARLTYLEPAQLRRKLGSIGRAIPNVEIVVLREDGSIARPNEVGELVARGANISPGYWNNPEETARKFVPLGYRTGDLGFADEEGYLYLVGRRDDMIKVGAHRVGAKEIEDVLNGHPAVHEAAVVGTPDALLGEIPVAFLALRVELLDPVNDLRAYCASKLPPHKVPSRWVIQSELPKIAGIGKVDKRTLREQATSESQHTQATF